MLRSHFDKAEFRAASGLRRSKRAPGQRHCSSRSDMRLKCGHVTTPFLFRPQSEAATRTIFGLLAFALLVVALIG